MNPKPPDRIRQLLDIALAEWDKVQVAAQTEIKQELQAADRLTTRIEEKMARDRERIDRACRHTYGVFAVDGSARHMVLRDIADLDGRPPLHSTGSFTEALELAGSSLSDPVHCPSHHVNLDKLANTVRDLLRALRHIAAVNALLGGQGTSDDPYVVAPGTCLHISGPVALAFRDTTTDQLLLTSREHRLYAMAAPASPPS